MNSQVLKPSQVFLFTVQNNGNAGVDSKGSPVAVTQVVCSIDEESAREYMEMYFSDLRILNVTSLIKLEGLVKKLRAAVAGESERWTVLVDPQLMNVVTA